MATSSVERTTASGVTFGKIDNGKRELPVIYLLKLKVALATSTAPAATGQPRSGTAWVATSKMSQWGNLWL